jgi:Concanavalin A-like lectin/glucanases superfamily/Purple acid Phosphatase, N-terminal domain
MSLPQCDAFGFIYDQAGDPAADILVVLKRVLDASGNPILLSPKTTVTDSAGSFHFTLPEAATAFISARASALWNCPDGRAFTVPPGPSGELIPSFALPASTFVEPPLVYVGDVLSIPKASASQDGYLSAADYVAFQAGAAEMGITQIDTGPGLTGGPITDQGTISHALMPGLTPGIYSGPLIIQVNAYGHITAISGAGDTTAPIISAVTATSITLTSVTITWTTNEQSDSQVEYGTTTSYGSSSTPDSTLVTSHTCNLSGLTPATLYHYRVKSTDISANPATSADFTFTTSSTPDTTPPIISAISATSITDTGATITWTTNEASDSQVEYGLTTSYGSSTTLDTTMVTSHSVPISGLTASTLYHYRVKSKDAAGNPQTGTDNTFTTTAGAPVDLLTSLIGYWKLDETAGLRADSTAGAHSLTPTGTIATATSKPGFNICPQFAGDGAFLSAGDNSFASMGAAVDYTMAAWVQLQYGATDRTFISKAGGGTGHDEYVITHSSSASRFWYTVQATSGSYYTVSADDLGAPALNTWYLVVCWHNTADSTIHIQVNNGADNSFVLIEPIGTRAQPFCIGSYGSASSNFWYGLIDEVAIWQARVLDATERSALWNGGAGKPFDTW